MRRLRTDLSDRRWRALLSVQGASELPPCTGRKSVTAVRSTVFVRRRCHFLLLLLR
jgi:hypothetical protein